MPSNKELEGIEEIISDIKNSKDFVQEAIYWKFTQEEVNFSFEKFSIEGLNILKERLGEIDAFELCRKVDNLIKHKLSK